MILRNRIIVMLTDIIFDYSEVLGIIVLVLFACYGIWRGRQNQDDDYYL